MIWGADRDATLTRMKAEGSTYSQITTAMDVTRSAVCGRLRRLGLAKPAGKRLSDEERILRNRLIDKKYREKKKPLEFDRKKAARGRVDPTFSPPLDPTDVVPLHLSLMDLEPHHCRWPYGDRNFTFCGCTKISDGPYCYSHHQLSLRPSTYRVAA